MAVHDFTKGFWGHSVNILKYDPVAKECYGVCWVTPGLKDDDTIVIPSRKGTMTLRVFDVVWISNTDDMYRFNAEPVL